MKTTLATHVRYLENIKFFNGMPDIQKGEIVEIVRPVGKNAAIVRRAIGHEFAEIGIDGTRAEYVSTLENPSPALTALFHSHEWMIVATTDKAKRALDRFHRLHDIFDLELQAGQFVIGKGSGDKASPIQYVQILKGRRFLKKYACQLTLAPL